MSLPAQRPFHGIRVLDLTHVLAGPFCAYQLALLGADVIKIEPPGMPDTARGRGPDDALNAAGLGINYLVQGANKRSLALDLATGEGRAILLDLVADADVLVENYRTGALAALGLGPETLQARNPRLICCSITGFARGHEREAVNAYDNVIQAASGVMARTTGRAGEPVKSGASFIDYATGYAAAFAISAALFQRQASGVGQVIDCSMFETALTLMAPEAAAALYEGPSQPRPKEAGLGTYETADGLLMLGAFNTRQNKRLWEALGSPDFAALDSWPELWASAQTMREALVPIMRTRTAAEWEIYLHRIGIPAERVRTLEEAVCLPHLDKRGFFHALQPGEAGAAPVSVPLAPFSYATAGPAIDRAPPRLGEHSDEILGNLGRSPAEIVALRERGIVA
ncbi:CaiB/BaiF CoA-transferase family protein [Bosea sp. 47.2.35]|uniref:CaiB/BaiF CoA transferase family protein n=1 Tax=Bosea sp. 47.2.35 TaxID=2969304 RepID=UPI00214F7795|nr:CoA transferase [Bosea sp. 47.2.35]MCR4520035.1 CoA transferase [Bosea sp. 47.2.35]